MHICIHTYIFYQNHYIHLTVGLELCNSSYQYKYHQNHAPLYSGVLLPSKPIVHDRRIRALSSPMNSTTGHHYTRLPKALQSDVADNRRNMVAPMPIMEIAELPASSYRAISTVPSRLRLCCIIISNCFRSGCICLCLCGFSNIVDLTQWEKWAFNTLSFLLSAALGFGIGFLFDQVGLLARGTVLQGRPYSVKRV